MSFVEPITIRDAIDNLHKKNYLLPAIQREFVWSPEQIERLFDSLMRDYPLSSFLFREVEKQNIGKYQFYEFVRNYHERDIYIKLDAQIISLIHQNIKKKEDIQMASNGSTQKNFQRSAR